MKEGDLSVHLKTAVVGAAAALALVLSGCGKKDEAIKIGHAGPLHPGLAPAERSPPNKQLRQKRAAKVQWVWCELAANPLVISHQQTNTKQIVV